MQNSKGGVTIQNVIETDHPVTLVVRVFCSAQETPIPVIPANEQHGTYRSKT